ncbi:hypothetical protein CUJ88_08245 [Paraburkholderia hospita]|nr:hypothetical protein CUJ88_08245 [Paraburkholderia hospita]
MPRTPRIGFKFVDNIRLAAYARFLGAEARGLLVYVLVDNSENRASFFEASGRAMRKPYAAAPCSKRGMRKVRAAI